ncbi:MAG TPA: flagellar biosynthesis protein FliQ [Bacillota bacterium]|jgi:flagellar biosynthetic protein FliQ|nr:flagellar biosynthesis protein FliQ [Bacillota bacterium]HOB86169.1 flagellar biosynthesis protein FliQ [Bacillota bacterium]HOP68880.1 flagellar biosynthesis protein FliQ [Bacillota bacterium]HPT33387.1 flagellar biosynthesis protein FliQ [Bacillota bacterium]HPZ64164.1 flagellar biosynthesis protein FliQ [Bacillota bacterium]
MQPETVLYVVREAITVTLFMVAPILGSGLIVGLVISLIMATTQIQEPTLAFVPKIIAVLLAIIIFGGWVINLVIQFTLNLWGSGLGQL